MSAPERDMPIGAADIEARIAELEKYEKDAAREVTEAKTALWRAEQSHGRITREIAAWSEALAVLKKAGLNL